MKESEILKQIIQNRRSIYPRDYSGEKIPPELMSEIIASADYAPSHKKTKPWRFLHYQGTEKQLLALELQKIYRAVTPPRLFLQKKMDDIAAKIAKSDTIVPVVVNFSGLVPEWEEIAATAMAVQNMYLTCTAHKIGGYWSSPSYAEHLSGFLKLSENQRCLGLFYIGMRKSEDS